MLCIFSLPRGLVQALLLGGLLGSTPTMAQTNRIDQIRSDAPALAAYGPFDLGGRTPQQLTVQDQAASLLQGKQS